jgi:two-component system cell cycle response regulator
MPMRCTAAACAISPRSRTPSCSWACSGCARSPSAFHWWTASLATGIAAQQVAAQAQCPPDESFTCGLLSGIGQLALATAFPVEYSEILVRNLNALALREAESGNFGLDHATLSSELLEDWGLPEIFHQAVRYHELPTEAPFAAGSRAQALTNALHFSSKVGMLLNMESAERWERLPSLYHAAAQLGLEDTQVPPLVETVVAQWHDWGRELRLPTRDFSDLAVLLTTPPGLAAENGPSALVVLPMRLALVAYDATLLRNLAETLDAMGLLVELAPDKESALRLLAQRSADIMMVQLPDSGDESTRKLRELCTSEGGRQAYCIALIPPEAEANVAKLMLAGASDYLLFDHSESALLARLNSAQRVVTLQSAVRTERETVIRSSGEWARSNRRLLQEALTDPLTRLHNRRYGMDRFNQEWSYAMHSDAPLSCLMLDIDHFKAVNDRYGHETGDLVLTQVARVIQHSCRKDDVAFRFGGEEFCIVAPGTPVKEATHLGERIVRAIRKERFGKDEALFHITISIGVASRDAGDNDLDTLIERADKALYAAKDNGRDRVMVARGDLGSSD